jgi:hypothetical protein
MDIKTAYHYLSLGYRIRRLHHPQGFWLSPISYYSNLTIEDGLANDWEIMTDNIVKQFPITYESNK